MPVCKPGRESHFNSEPLVVLGLLFEFTDRVKHLHSRAQIPLTMIEKAIAYDETFTSHTSH